MDRGLQFSIIIPSFNQGKFLRQTIESILDQSYPSVEIIVVDGGSTDESVEVLRSFGNKIRWQSEPDRGQTHAINKGIAQASGDILAYLNSDDYYLPGTLQKVVTAFETNTAANWLTGDYEIVDVEGKPMQSPIGWYKRVCRKALSFSLLSILNPIAQPSTFFRRRLVDQLGPFDEALRYTMDYDYWMRAIQVQKPIVLTDKLSAFRIHPTSKGGSQFRQQFAEELQVAKKYQKRAIFVWLHQAHNALITGIYSLLK